MAASTSSSSSFSENSVATPAPVSAVLFGATILVSAFLLFQVQPLIAKLILPWFGGSAAVWTSCLLFFQVALLAGYAYAHWLSEKSGRVQNLMHLGLIAISFLSLPILPNAAWKPQGAEDPLLRILGLLAATVGLPYFLLSSTSPLLQSWYSRTNGGAMPYRFFALSNAGSMLGLLTYPVLVEPYLTNRQQAWMWSISYLVFVVLCSAVALRSRGARAVAQDLSDDQSPAPVWSERFIWMGLAACASALLLAVTNHLTQNVAAIPFLWVLPLSLYLLSFILCFDSDRWYQRWIFTRLGAVTLPAMAYAISSEASFSDLRLAVAFFSVALFILFMVCHGELARRRPSPRHLTAFYLMVSVGGAVGGLLIGFVAPYLTNALYDLPVVICLTAFLLLWLLWRERRPKQDDAVTEKFLDEAYDKFVIGTLFAVLLGYIVYRLHAANHGGPKFLNADYDPWVLLGIAGAIALYVLWRGRGSVDEGIVMLIVSACICIGMAGFLARDTYNSIGDSRVLARNFYGALRVYDSDSDGNMGQVRTLRHGTIDHGEEFLEPQYQRFAATYYAKESGVGLAIANLQQQGPMNVGVIGLGSGTLTTYERAQDHYTVYDINPVVVKIAETQFMFLKNCLGPHEIVLGDARLSLEGEPSKQFDLLVVDAFSGDAIPVHLLTREAFALYWRHLKPDGVLAVHVSNRFLSLGPVVDLGAAADHKRALMFSNDEDDNTEVAASDWVLVTSRQGFFDEPGIKQVGKKIEPIAGLRMWTDDYSNLYKILR